MKPLAVGRPQCDMQHGAVLGDVDLVAGEHGVAPALHVRRLGERCKQRHGFTRDRAFRPVEQEAAGAERQLGEAAGVFGEGRTHRFRDGTRAVGSQFSQSLVKNSAVQFAILEFTAAWEP